MRVPERLAVTDGVGVCEDVGVLVADDPTVEDGVCDGVIVPVLLKDPVRDGVGVRVGLFVPVGVRVGVCVLLGVAVGVRDREPV